MTGIPADRDATGVDLVRRLAITVGTYYTGDTNLDLGHKVIVSDRGAVMVRMVSYHLSNHRDAHKGKANQTLDVRCP